jgi:hypothetical protein
MAARNLTFSTIAWITISIIVVLIASAYCILSATKGDPADHFAVLRIVSDDASRRHAVVYRYYHANSSSAPIAVWTVLGDVPDTRPNIRLDGPPSLVWTRAAGDLRLVWSQADRRLAAEVVGRADLRTESGFQGCFFKDEAEINRLCF